MTLPKMQLVDWLDDLSVRFIINLPREELQSVERICFQVEEAQWFYEDFVRPTDPHLPSMNLKQFCLAIFHHCPLFAGFDVNVYMQAFQEFLAYKSRVPVRGAILLNDAMDEVVLVRGWKKGANWSFPRGKINKAEDDLDCAVREVFEETGLDVRTAGLVNDSADVRSIELTMREQSIKLFVIPNVPKDFKFEPQTRKEIGSIQWYKLADLPTNRKLKQQQGEGYGDNLANHANKFYMVAPFLGYLKKIITQLRKTQAGKAALENYQDLQAQLQAVAPSAAVQAAPSVVEQWSGHPNEMDRLVLQLRQSKEAHREQNLPEVTQPTELGLDGLPVNPSLAVQHPPVQQGVPLQRAPSNALTQNIVNGSNGVSVAPNFQQPGPVYPNLQHPQPLSNEQGNSAFNHYMGQQVNLNQLLNQPVQHSQQSLVPSVVPGGSYPASYNQYPPQVPDQAWSQTPLGHPNQPQVIHAQIVPPSPIPSLQTQGLPQAGVGVPAAYPFPAQPTPATPITQSQPGNQPIAPVPTLLQLLMQPGGAPPNSAAVPAPYQTGDPNFAPTPNPGNRPDPAIPEPSNLPIPKLTANSAKLLSLFTGKQQATKDSGPVSPAEMSADQQNQLLHGNVNQGLLLNESNTHQKSRPPNLIPMHSLSEAMRTPALASPTEIGVTSPTTSRPRTSQQSALLDLFKAQSGRHLGTPSPALAPGPQGTFSPAELSAAQSPAQSFSQFERRAGSSEALAPHSYGKISVQKRQGTHPAGNAMSATVTGPLNISEQELNKKSGDRAHRSNVSVNKTALTPGNVKIMSRPGTSSGHKGTSATPKQGSPKQHRSPRAGSNGRPAQHSPRPFQPQILKRPVEHSADNTAKELRTSSQSSEQRPVTILRRESDYTSPTVNASIPTMPQRSTPTIDRGIVEAPSPMSRHTSATEENPPLSAITPGPTPFVLDSRPSQAGEQKANLLSLFHQKTSALNVQPTAQPLAVTSSPMSSLNGPRMASVLAGGSQAVVSPMSAMAPRARMDSMVSVGSGDSLAGRSTPQTTNEKDKKFLLGFLNNVADGKGL